MIIRQEQPADIDAIRALTAAAFAGHPHSAGTEPAIIDRLRTAGALTLSLVAVEASIIVGHVAFSPVSVSDGTPDWYGLGPLSVLPARQGQGIGTRLVTGGLQRLETMAAAGCVLLGEPAYYRRFGFRSDFPLVLEGVPPGYFLVRPLADAATSRGIVQFHPAFASM